MGPGVRRDDGKGRRHKIAPAPATTRPPPVILAKARIQNPKRTRPRHWVLGRARDDGRGWAHHVSRHRSPGRSGRQTRNDPHPIRHPGERRDPWLRRTRRSRAAITRPATMGPGVRRDDGKERRDKIAPAPATARIQREPSTPHPQRSQPAPSRHPGESRDPEPQAHPPAALSPGSGRNDDRQGVASYPANLHQPLIRTSPHPSLTSGRN